MAKILILVLSYMEPPYDVLLKTQRETWDSVEVEGVRTVYYYGGSGGWVAAGYNSTPLVTQRSENSGWSLEVQFDCTDAYYYMGQKFKLALQYIEDWDYDIIFRTNSSSYIDKQRL
jgi:hypothetical protein